MSIKKRILINLILFLIFLFVLSNTVFGQSLVETFKDKIFIGSGSSQELQTTGGKIIGIIQVVGNIASIVMLIVIGIKYMIGSVEERADYKKTLFPYLVGAILIFSAVNLTQAIYNWASTL